MRESRKVSDNKQIVKEEQNTNYKPQVGYCTLFVLVGKMRSRINHGFLAWLQVERFASMGLTVPRGGGALNL